MELTQEQQKKLKKVAKLVDFKSKGATALLEYLFELDDKYEEDIPQLGELIDELRKDRPDRDEVKELVSEIVGSIKIPEAINGEKGDKGDSYILTMEDKTAIAKLIDVPVVEKVIEKTTETIVREQPIEIIKEVAVVIDADITSRSFAVRDALEIIVDEEDKLKIDAIQNLRKELDELKATNGEHRVISSNRNLYQLLDVDVSGITTDQSIKWNGQKWIPYTPDTGGGVQSIVPGTNITVDDTDPENPIVAGTGITSATQTALDLKYDASNPSGYITSSALSAYVPTSRTLTINGTALDLSTDRSWTITTASGANPTATIGLTAVNGSASTFLRSDGAPALSQAIVPTWTGTHTFSGGLVSSIPAIVTSTGTGTFSGATSGASVLITGTGTSFTTQLKVGDVFIHSSSGNNGMITRIVSDTSLYVEGTYLNGRSGAFSYYPAPFYQKNSAGIVGLAQTPPILKNSAGTYIGAGTYITSAFTLFANSIAGAQHTGVYIRDYASDGRMIMGHNMSPSSYILFPGGASSMTIESANISNGLYSGTVNLCASSNGSDDVRWAITRSGSGANQTISALTQRFAVNNDAPNLLIGANGINIGRRDGSTWNEGIDQITLSMDKTTGYWQVGDLGTTTPTGVSARFTITDTTRTLRQRYDASNYFDTSVSSTGGVTFDAVGSGAGFTFSDQITGSSGYVGSDLTASLPVKTDGSKKLVSGAIDIASSEITGTLPIANGGTGVTSFGTGGVIFFNGTSQATDGNFTFASDILSAVYFKPVTNYKSADGSDGASGSFTTTDGKTVTVKEGIITSIV